MHKMMRLMFCFLVKRRRLGEELARGDFYYDKMSEPGTTFPFPLEAAVLPCSEKQ
jgi:hypothetical protein